MKTNPIFEELRQDQRRQRQERECQHYPHLQRVITIRNIPLAAYDYIVNGKPAVLRDIPALMAHMLIVFPWLRSLPIFFVLKALRYGFTDSSWKSVDEAKFMFMFRRVIRIWNSNLFIK
jgi:hypothetical protein